MQRIDMLRNLLVMAASDGSLSEREIKFITNRCQQWGMDEAALAEAVEYALSADAEVAIPPRRADRMQMLKDFISMMAADGSLAEVEKNLFAVVAARMGFSDQELNALIDSLVQP